MILNGLRLLYIVLFFVVAFFNVFSASVLASEIVR
jgi:hypothetical protein